MVRQRAALEARGTRLCLVHPAADDEKARAFFAKYALPGPMIVADSEGKLHDSFALRRGGLGAFLHPRVLWRGLKAFLSGHGAGRPRGDALRLGGAFLLAGGSVRHEKRFRDAAERAPYAEMLA